MTNESSRQDPANETESNVPTENQTDATTANPEDASEQAGGDPIAQLQNELREANNKWMRSEAELDNFRKRARREIEDNAKFASVPLITDLLQVMDNLSRAVEAAEKQEAEQNSGLLQGVKMVVMQLEHTLEKHGCQPIASVGEAFDPNHHEAISMEPSDEHPANTVVRETQRGYRIHDRVIRPAQVCVAAPKS